MSKKRKTYSISVPGLGKVEGMATTSFTMSPEARIMAAVLRERKDWLICLPTEGVIGFVLMPVITGPDGRHTIRADNALPLMVNPLTTECS